MRLTKAQWLEKNGFNSEGFTYLIKGNTYEIKDMLKEAGFVYSPLLSWHGSEKLSLPDGYEYITIAFDSVYEWNEKEAAAYPLPHAKVYLLDLLRPVEKVDSSYQGEIGERLRNIAVEVVNITGFEGNFGYTWAITFKDNQSNLYSWFTTGGAMISRGQRGLLTGTVKEHKEYRGNQTTQLTRCILKPQED